MGESLPKESTAEKTSNKEAERRTNKYKEKLTKNRNNSKVRMLLQYRIGREYLQRNTKVKIEI